MTHVVSPLCRCLCLLMFLLSACEKGGPVLNEGTVITLQAQPSTVLNFGDTSVITIRAFESDGRPVLDGSRIQLTATAGSVTGEVRTADGLATAVFTSGAVPGSVTVTAQSGSLAGDGSVFTTVEVLDRDVAISAAGLTANPSNLSSLGGQVGLRFVVFGPDNEPLPGKPVVFSADFGSLAANGAVLYTDAGGQAYDTLSLSNLPPSISAVTVTATSGVLTESATVTITTNETPTPVMVVSPAAPREGETAFFSGETSSDVDGSVVAYAWDMGDGTLLQGASVSHVFATPRDYNVILRVTDNQGASAALTQTLTVGANQAPTASFTISDSNPRINEPVVFDARGSTDPDGSIASYEWFLGNGSTRTGASTTFAYPGAQTYTVTLVVTDNAGATGVSQKQVTVTGNQLPVAEFVYSPRTPRVDEPVNFFATPSVDPDGSIVTYAWEFGDFNTQRGPAVAHVYQQTGTYEVLLTVTDNDGGVGYITDTVVVGDNLAPTAGFTVSPGAPNVGQAVFFDGGASSDPDGTITGYTWEFGDGTFGSGVQANHVYTVAGDYQAVLTVRDNDGKQGIASQLVRVQNGSVPTAALTVEPSVLTPPGGYVLLDGSATTDGEDGLSNLTFAFSASKPDHVTLELDGGTGPLRQAQIGNLDTGDRVAFLMLVTDTDGNQSAATAVVSGGSGEENQAPEAAMVLTPTSLLPPGGSVILDGSTSSDADHTQTELSYAFSAQTTGDVVVSIAGTGPIRTATVSDGLAGDTVTFRLTVTDPLGAQGTVYKLLSITDEPPNQLPTAVLLSTPSGSVPQPSSSGESIRVILDASGSFDDEDTLNELSFDFAANLPANINLVWDDTVTVPYLAVADLFGAVSGDNLVFSVTVTDSAGGEDFDFVTIAVTNPAKR